ncbi:tyrosine-type recombinase/integrase [Isobaculum melis]|uniref:Site-specific recombinase XerD n=1 Tax=Isobaculum melis TaxID=142588 RepID=A0A1H9TQD6_9LACT|nr:site-specific integrase [Isobaculum melis]SER99237.1 Site-specific recombinase XerD [Isobaculum melis]
MASFQKYQTQKGARWLFKEKINGKYSTRRGFKTKQEAKLACAKIVRKSQFLFDDKAMFKEVAEIWLNDYRKTGIKVSTLSHKEAQASFFSEKFKNEKISAITSEMIEDIFEEMKSEGYAYGTIKNYKKTISLIMKYALKKQFIYFNVVGDVRMPFFDEDVISKKEAIERKYLNLNELKEFLAVSEKTHTDEIHTLFLLISETGMRIGEALSLLESDLDIENNTIEIYKSLTRIAVEDFKLTTPKTTSSVRKVFVRQSLMDKLKKIMKKNEQIREKMTLKSDYKLLFFSKAINVGNPYLVGTINDKIEEVVAQTSIKKHVTSRTFRHTAVSMLAEAGVSLEAIKEMMGHSSSKITETIYLHVTDYTKKDTLLKLDALMKKIGQN